MICPIKDNKKRFIVKNVAVSHLLAVSMVSIFCGCFARGHTLPGLWLAGYAAFPPDVLGLDYGIITSLSQYCFSTQKSFGKHLDTRVLTRRDDAVCLRCKILLFGDRIWKGN